MLRHSLPNFLPEKAVKSPHLWAHNHGRPDRAAQAALLLRPLQPLHAEAVEEAGVQRPDAAGGPDEGPAARQADPTPAEAGAGAEADGADVGEAGELRVGADHVQMAGLRRHEHEDGRVLTPAPPRLRRLRAPGEEESLLQGEREDARFGG